MKNFNGLFFVAVLLFPLAVSAKNCVLELDFSYNYSHERWEHTRQLSCDGTLLAIAAPSFPAADNYGRTLSDYQARISAREHVKLLHCNYYRREKIPTVQNEHEGYNCMFVD